MKTTLKALCAAGLLALTVTMPLRAEEKKAGTMSCTACTGKGNTLSAGCGKSMMSKMSATDKKTFMGMSAAEKALVGKMMHSAKMGGKAHGKM
jgi:hypothetical protein